MRRTDAALSIGEDGLVRRHSLLVQDAANLLGRFESMSFPVHHVEPLQMHRAGNMSDSLVAPAGAAVILAVASHVPEDRVLQTARRL